MIGILLSSPLAALLAATQGGLRLTPGVIQLGTAGIAFLGVAIKLIVQARKQMPPDVLADYAAHRLSELEDENASLRLRIDGLEAQVAALTSRLAGT